jgi:hypothetical protein
MASFNFASFRNPNFVDWEGTSDSNIPYTSYMHSFYQVAEDPMFNYQTPYVYFYLAPQTPNDDPPPITATESLLFQGAWNWTTADGPSKFSRSEELYKYRYSTLVTPKRVKVRGNGKVLQMRYTSNPTLAVTTNYGLGWSLYAWGIVIGKNTGP